ncbi:MAG: M28 family peptidase [Candidatus Thorarchaeota archaeon]|nr:M28 family peptidase [Candidatus Thorarchaeota archaeon]
MVSRKSPVIVTAIVLATIVIISLMQVAPPPDTNDGQEEPAIVPHPFNSLNWWDIPWYYSSESDITTVLSRLYAIGPRFDGTPGYTQAAEYVISRLQEFSIPSGYWGPHHSVVAVQKGYGTDVRSIVFGAHLDSDESSSGIEQNGGGVAVVLTIASILAEYRLPVDIYYCFYAGNMEFLDEQHMNRALYGSKEVVAELENRGVSVIVSYNFDELLYRSLWQSPGSRLIAEHEADVGQGYHRTKYFADLFASFMRKSGQSITSVQQLQQVQTDHIPFMSAGIPAVNVRSGHQPDPEFPPVDSPYSTDYDCAQALYAARAAASVAVYLGMQGNGQQTVQMLQATLLPYATARLHAVMTMSQTLSVHGNSTSNSTLRLTLTQGSTTLISSVLAPHTFEYESSTQSGLGELTLSVTNTGNGTEHALVYLTYDSDTDGDGVLDADEYSWPDPNPPLDWDDDGLSDADESVIGTDIFVTDTDKDGISDSVEVACGLNPLRDDHLEDYDSDGIANGLEIGLGTSPVLNDTDSDGMPDGWEVQYGTNPLDSDGQYDPDNDTLTNLQEYLCGSDPLSVDGDGDGVSDTDEVRLGMNPLSDDTDSDGLRDYLELANGLDPLTPDYDLDAAADGSDANPRVNWLVVMCLLGIAPVAVGSLTLWRRIR